MSVGVEGESCGEVAQHTGYRLDVYSVLQRQRRKGVAEVVEPNLGQSRSLQHSVEHIQHAVRGDGASIRRWAQKI